MLGRILGIILALIVFSVMSWGVLFNEVPENIKSYKMEKKKL